MEQKQKPRISRKKTSPATDDLLQLEENYCSWGDTVHYAKTLKIFNRCDGIYLYDKKGVEYLDLQMWYSAVNFGYKNPRLNEALKRQLDTLPQLACQYLHEEKILLATKIARRIEATLETKGRVHFNVGGSAAIEDSLKVVRNHTKKNLVFAFMGGYHGRTLGATAITSSFRYREKFGHFSDRAVFIPYPYCFRCPYDKKREFCDMYCLAQFERLFETEYHSVVNPKTSQCECAAFYIEPVQGTGGYIVPPREYFPGLKEILDRYNILMVDDEIQMGFYRAGKMWAIENFNVTPDVIVFGKAVTNGLNPLSGIWAREELINPTVFPAGSTHSTFNANPLGTAVALEAIKMMEETDYEAMTKAKGAYFLKGLQDLKSRYPIIGDVDGMGMALRMEICQSDGFTPDKAIVDRMVDEALLGNLEVGGKQYGLILDIGGYYKNVVTLAPSLHMSYEEIDLAIKLLDVLLHRVTRT